MALIRRRAPRVTELAPLIRLKTPQLNRTKARLESALTIEDLRRIAKRRTPRAAFDYTDGAAEDELSLARARQAFRDIEFHPTILRDVAMVDTTREVLGGRSALPFGIAPTGFTRLMQTEGEIGGAGAAAKAGIPFSLSTLGTTTIEDLVAAVPQGRKWFQLYMWRDRDRSMALVQRAADAGFDTLLVTVDVPVAGARLRDTRNGMSIPPALTARTILDAIPRPRWWFDLLTTEPLSFAELDQWPGTVGEYLDSTFDPSVTFEDLAWIKTQWPHKLVVKGIQTLTDARSVVALGVDGIVLSNHGGRQLDRAPVPFHLLPQVARELGRDTEVMVDTGIMAGADIVAAIALGARFTLVGRAYLYGLMAGGEAGVDRAIEILSDQVRRTMALLGVASLDELTPKHVTQLERLGPRPGNEVPSKKVERISINFGGLMAEATRTSSSVPVLFLSDPIVLPGMVVPIELDDAARAAVDAAQASESGKLLIAPRLDDRYPTYGVLASIVQVGRIAGSGGAAAVVRGEGRAHIGSGTTGPGAALWVEVTEVADTTVDDEVKALAAEYKKLLLAMLQRREAWQIVDVVNKISDPSALADTAGYASYLTDVQKRELLETEDVAQRLRVLIGWTSEHLAETEVNDKIADDVRSGMEKTQKEFLLRQQLAAIRKELGEGEPDGSDDYRARVEAADLPEKVREAAMREVGKLERSSEQSPEGGWIRTWLDTVLDLPWNVTTEDSTDLKSAREILDADHHGLDDVKDRIVEYLAVRARRSQRGLQVVGGRGSGAVMVLAGPPGVGKTSLGESVARALGRKFVRVALGGVRDEAEIRGHRRTYVGALPGRLVRAIGEAGSMNPVVLLDEIDKVGSDYRGDPSAALLEVLDPAQNHTFRDHYLDLDLDLSDVVFLATANVIENIPSALLDRMELVTIDGYTEDDKVAIARDFLLPRQRDRAALTAEEVTVTDDALHKIAADYTREPGVRQFERLLAKALRKATTKLAADPTALVIDEPDLVAYLGRPRFTPESEERTAVPGVATGLAVTGLGGDVLFIEVNGTDGEPGLKLTGQLGDVMKESAQIALSYVRAHAEQLGVDPKALDRQIHVHVPAGAVPKDGPSAGVTMVTALVSMATGRKVRADVGMTGEVTLNGRVLPIGGVKQKLLAAQRNGLKTIFIPARNEPDLDDVPAEVLEALEVKPMTDVAEIVALALEPAAEPAAVAA